MAPKPDYSSLEIVEARGWAEIQQHVRPAFRQRVDVRVERVAEAFTILAPKSEMAALNRVWLPGTAARVTPEALEQIRGHARGVGVKKLVAHCPEWAASPGLMAEHGFQRRASWFKFAREPSNHLPASPVRVEQIGSGDAALFGAIAAAGNEAEEWMADGFNSTVGMPGWNHYLAFDGETPIGAAALFVHERYAWCCFAGTIPSYRRRGAQLTLLYRRIRDAAQAGCDWIVSETRGDNPGSTRNHFRAGFAVVYERPNYTTDLSL